MLSLQVHLIPKFLVKISSLQERCGHCPQGPGQGSGPNIATSESLWIPAGEDEAMARLSGMEVLAMAGLGRSNGLETVTRGAST